LKTRVHAITFRLDEPEYEELIKAVAARGARSISDFARSAVMNKLAAQKLNRFLDDDLSTLGIRLDTFDTALRELRRHIRHLLAMSEHGSI
jgi:hypothetical protein